MDYLNYRCKKCGQIISREVTNERVLYQPAEKLWVDKNRHDCPERQSDTEKVFFELVSRSEEPIGKLV